MPVQREMHAWFTIYGIGKEGLLGICLRPPGKQQAEETKTEHPAEDMTGEELPSLRCAVMPDQISLLCLAKHSMQTEKSIDAPFLPGGFLSGKEKQSARGGSYGSVAGSARYAQCDE